MEIKGLYNTAECFTENIETSAVEQIKQICDIDAFSTCKIRIMPDVHMGKGCTIGTTLTVTDKIVPAMVGVDIGCGMYTVELGKVDIDLAKFDAIAHSIPSGRDIWEGRIEKFDLTALKCYRELSKITRLKKSLGTLGGGNHFIELDMDDDGNKYLVVHSGSRNLGKQVAEYYQGLAVDLNKGKEEYFNKRDEIIRAYKEQGRKAEIQTALVQLKKNWEAKEASLPEDLCFLYGQFMQDYLADIVICQAFARRNRELIAQILLEKSNLTPVSAFHTEHNFVSVNEMILRKGAVSARAGEKILIPINMRDGSLICIGKGNAEWNFSAPHGAGRLMSRAGARERLTMEQYREQMQGIYSTCIVPQTLDESPMAYKSMAEIIENIQPTATIVKQIKPIYNFKATN